ncbi:MAG: hydroxymethylglutaryl-CoA reductase [Gammaproteobacteria bacterium]
MNYEQTVFRNAVEHFIGTVRVPVGLAGPLIIHGLYAEGDFFIPLATTEAALVASYHRGMKVIARSGGCHAALLEESIHRTPGFAFATLSDACYFSAWLSGQLSEFQKLAESTSSHCRLTGMQTVVEGNHVYVKLGFFTSEAAGQNMITVATDAICAFIKNRAPVGSNRCYIDGNASGDKKASLQALGSVRGKRVSAEIVIPGTVVKKLLQTSATEMADYWRMAAIGGIISGTTGIQAHFANALAALYIACGQDAACVAESAVGVTRLELAEGGDLYAAVTLPNIVVGTVGGGTRLPDQKGYLNLLGVHGDGSARALAEIVAGLCLAGELSIVAAMCSGGFARAHQVLGRGRAARTTRANYALHGNNRSDEENMPC